MEGFIGHLEEEDIMSRELIENLKMLYFAGTATIGSLITTHLGYLD